MYVILSEGKVEKKNDTIGEGIQNLRKWMD